MGIIATDTNETIALIDYVEGVNAGIEAGLDGEPPAWDEVPEGRGSALAEWVGKYPNLFERMCEVASLVRHGGTHTARMVIVNQPLPLAWPSNGWVGIFYVLPGPRIEACVGALVVATGQQPKQKALAHIYRIDLAMSSVLEPWIGAAYVNTGQLSSGISTPMTADADGSHSPSGLDLPMRCSRFSLPNVSSCHSIPVTQ